MEIRINNIMLDTIADGSVLIVGPKIQYRNIKTTLLRVETNNVEKRDRYIAILNLNFKKNKGNRK